MLLLTFPTPFKSRLLTRARRTEILGGVLLFFLSCPPSVPHSLRHPSINAHPLFICSLTHVFFRSFCCQSSKLIVSVVWLVTPSATSCLCQPGGSQPSPCPFSKFVLLCLHASFIILLSCSPHSTFQYPSPSTPSLFVPSSQPYSRPALPRPFTVVCFTSPLSFSPSRSAVIQEGEEDFTSPFHCKENIFDF